ncbi:MAG: hypothetical protein AAGA20_06180, partial [Planctomycetota bacterium]
SFATPERVLFTRDRVVDARAATVEHRGVDVGMRCVAEAWAYLDGLPDVDAIDASSRARLVAVGARFGSAAANSLSAALERRPESGLLAALLEGALR